MFVCLSLHTHHSTLTQNSSQWSDPVALEKDRRLAKFERWADALGAALARRGAWSDAIDPCSGLPRRSPRGAAPYAETAGVRAVLPYAGALAGPCAVVLHPRWASACYPASLFTDASHEQLLAALAEIEQEIEQEQEKEKEKNIESNNDLDNSK